MKTSLFLFCLFLQVSCSNKVLLDASFSNTRYIHDAPVNILFLERDQKFTLWYPSVIGEKEIGIWELKSDTLRLYVKAAITAGFKDTLISNEIYLLKSRKRNKEFLSIDYGWVLKRNNDSKKKNL